MLSTLSVSAVQLADGETAMLNMENTDINTLISTVADKTGRNFIVDPRVKGKVTIISHQAITREELYQTFLSILEVHGFAAIPGDGVIKIVPDSTAKQSSIRTATRGAPGQGDELVTRVVMVDYVNAMQLVPILRPLIPQQGHMAAFPSSNVLIVSDRADNIARIMQLIKRIDRPSNDDVEVIALQHASAAEMVRVLASLRKSNSGKGAAAQVLVADERTNSILLGGNKSERLRLRALIAHLDTSTDDGGNTQVIYLKYADAASLVPVLTGVSANLSKAGGKAKKGAAARAASNISIQADENTNSLVITAQPALMRSLQSVIRQLDIRRAQVLVEAIIAEISSTKTSELGVQFGSLDTNNTGAISSEFPGTGPGVLSLAFGTDPVTSLGGGLNIGIGNASGDGRFGVLLRAIASDDDSNLLSTPNLVMLDNEEAEIIVGQNVPFVTGSQQTTGGLANPFQTIQRQDVGLTLRVKPQINEGDALKLDITQEISSVVPDNSSVTSADIITNKRSIKTSVLVDDGEIIMLGGLISDDLTEGVSKVPVLGDIPLLGNLFRSRTTRKVKTNLVVFLHPVILKGNKSQLYTSRKYNYIRAKQLAAREDGVNLLSDDVAPILPELDKYLEIPPPYKEVSAAE
ncbi:MAG: type II secretion system secretin GspD [Sulfuriflexus sp.]|nr:type II secretion system secretin GspD [Sulfuriflexus sp.]